ncbi:hypothetical protein QYF36_014413 [Acer negundo]|nr:hypothetical protein QYF36_014413 [Acer negundo]
MLGSLNMVDLLRGKHSIFSGIWGFAGGAGEYLEVGVGRSGIGGLGGGGGGGLGGSSDSDSSVEVLVAVEGLEAACLESINYMNPAILIVIYLLYLNI